MFGRPLPPDARVAHRWKAWVHGDDQQRVNQAFEEGLEDGSYSEVLRIVLPDGKTRWVHDRAIALPPLGVVRITSELPRLIAPVAATPVAAPAPAPAAAAAPAAAPATAVPPAPAPAAAPEPALDATELMLDLDARGGIRRASEAFAVLLGLSSVAEDAFLFDLVPPGDRTANRKAWDAFAVGTSASQEFTWRLAASRQRVVWVEARAQRVPGVPGGARFVVALRDVTRRKEAEATITRHGESLDQRLKERNKEFVVLEKRLADADRAQRLMMQALPDVVMRMDRTGQVLDIGGPPGQMLAPAAELIGYRFVDRPEFSDDARALWNATLERSLDGGRQQLCEFTLLGADGRQFEAIITPIDPQQAIVVVRDVAERNRLRERLRDLVAHDELTGLLSRTALLEQCDERIARAMLKPLGMIVINLDQFKQVNDSYGHEIGDTLLKIVANRVTRRGGADSLRARLNGDEFAIVVPLTEGGDVQAETTAFAQTLLAEIGTRMRLHGQTIYVTPSIGIALHPRDGGDAESLLRNANAAVTRVKETGRNNFQFYDPVEGAALTERVCTEQGLRHALAENRLQCLFQPKISVQGGAVLGLEALVRWNTDDGETIIPERFIPLAERSGLIRPVGLWVLRESLKEVSAFAKLGRAPIDLAINVSVVQLRDSGFIQTLREALDEFGFAPGRLTLEVAESAFIADMEATAEALGDVAALGVRISIDDFGTGYGGLSWLRNLPVNEIKIDRSFIKGCSIDAFDATIVSGLIEMAHNLGITIVAEGVERADQVAFLTQVQCDVMQGYYTGVPMSALELVKSNRIWQNIAAA